MRLRPGHVSVLRLLTWALAAATLAACSSDVEVRACPGAGCAVPALTAGCEGVRCGAGQTCVGGGCYTNNCSNLTCAEGALCSDQQCVKPRCLGVFCPSGTMCVEGECKSTVCDGIACGAGMICESNRCVDRSCDGLRCKDGSVCSQGACSSDTRAVTDAGVTDAGVTDAGVIPTYSIGGTVVGLAAGPLVLQNNGVEELAVNANGRFAFAQRQPTGAAYAITLKPGGLPTGMGQACTVLNGSGTVGTADVSEVQVRCTFRLQGTGGAIADSTTDTCSAGGPPLISTVTVDAAYFNVGSLEVTLENLVHSWSGDLRVVLEHVTTGTQVILIDRILNCTANDKLTGTFRFADSYGTTFCATASTQGRTLNGGNHAPCNNALQATRLSAPTPQGFSGESVQGTWRLNIADMDDGDDGSLGSWSVTFAPP